MKKTLIIMAIAMFATAHVTAQSSDSTKLRQLFSAKFGFYAPSGGLNNGLLLGLDGITEFMRHNFFLSGAVDLYPKKTIDIFDHPGPDISDQQIYLLPLHVNFGYKVLDVSDADTRAYLGAGGGYYFYFYNVSYSGSSGGGFLGGPVVPTSQSDSRNGGNVFFTFFGRAVIGKIFVEPRYIVAKTTEDAIGGYRYTVNPTGFSVSLGYEYH